MKLTFSQRLRALFTGRIPEPAPASVTSRATVLRETVTSPRATHSETPTATQPAFTLTPPANVRITKRYKQQQQVIQRCIKTPGRFYLLTYTGTKHKAQIIQSHIKTRVYTAFKQAPGAWETQISQTPSGRYAVRVAYTPTKEQRA